MPIVYGTSVYHLGKEWLMDFRQLDMLRAVAEETSFTRAAERLHVSQSAISRQIKLLEEELGSVLFHRGARRVQATEAGELLFRLANRVHRDMQEAVSQIDETRELRRGALTLAGGMTVCMYILPRLLKKYRSLYKQIDLRVVSGNSEEIELMLRNHEVDLALMTLPILSEDLEVLPVLKEEMVVVTAPGHPFSRKRSLEPAQLGKVPWVVYEAGSNTRKAIDRFFMEEKIPMQIAMETENVEIIKAMVAAGLGVTIIPYSGIARDLKHGRFGYARVRGWHLVRETGWVYLKSDYVPRTVTEMLRVFDVMKDQFRIRLPRS